MAESYLVNELYYTIQGEGVRYGIPHVFVRLGGCNLTCNFCDTEFESGRWLGVAEVLAEATALADSAYRAPEPGAEAVAGAKPHGRAIDAGPCRNVLFCGGEPLLQLDDELVAAFKAAGWYVVVETNGTRAAPAAVDWVTCSPKVAEHAIALGRVDELKYVRAAGQALPRPRLAAAHYLISPVFEGDRPDPAALAWCVALVAANPAWRLTVQHHKVGFGNLR